MDEGATQLTLASEGRVEMADMKGVIGPHEGFAPLWLFKRDTPLYVSGYLMMTDRIAQDATHAWAEAHISDLGWVGFDVSNQISPDARYVRVATGLDYSDSAPISGITLGGREDSISVDVQVQQ